MFAFRPFKKKSVREIAPDEIFLDSHNSPKFDRHQFEGRIERPIGRTALSLFSLSLLLIMGGLLYKTFSLQVLHGDAYREQAEQNRLARSVLFPDRGVIYDRTGTLLAWNELFENATSSDETRDFARRGYATTTSLAHVVGFVSYPKKDSSGFYFQEDTVGVSGIEKVYDKLLAGVRGTTIFEEDVHGKIISESVVDEPQAGKALTLTIDASIENQLATYIAELAENVGFSGGASVILDVRTGEVLALVSVPDYDPVSVSAGDAEALKRYGSDTATPFLNRAISGRYTPGSIIKPFVAIGALSEGVITPEKQIYSDGALRIPNPYDPEHPTIMKDWKAHGWTDVRHALAVSSDVYFYQVGGGFGDQPGLGIDRIDTYVSMFKIGQLTGIDLPGEAEGTIPTIAWKAQLFPDDPWRVGDTYNTAIGQYGFQVTPIQMARAVAAIANDGLLVTPHLLADTESESERIDVDPAVLQIVREGMRLSVTEGTSKAMSYPDFAVAGKSGTAELGVSKQNVNSWIVGFWPYENPRYAFATVMEHGPVTNLMGSASVMRRLFDWMRVNTPQYLE